MSGRISKTISSISGFLNQNLFETISIFIKSNIIRLNFDKSSNSFLLILKALGAPSSPIGEILNTSEL